MAMNGAADLIVLGLLAVLGLFVVAAALDRLAHHMKDRK